MGTRTKKRDLTNTGGGALSVPPQAIVMRFPPDRVALANGWYIGALGAVSATGPAELVVQSMGWRGAFRRWAT
jgi:hypothetical protein